MKIKNLIICIFLGFMVTSCIQDEALNSEAAIDGCTGKDVQLSNVDADNKLVNIYVHKSANLSKQNLVFTLPEGASIKANETVSGDTKSTYDFSAPSQTRKFTVTSEDGQWQPVYTVKIIPSELPSSFHFESLLVGSSSPFDVFYEFEQGTSQGASKVLQWASGNPGYKLTGMAKAASDYPTVQTTNGYVGKCVKLETRSTGSFGAMAKMYIAAGNLFIGSFDLATALANAPKATRFGFQFYKHPKMLKGYYKFKSGPVYTESGQPQSGLKDKCDIYAIMYEADDNSFMLNGENSLTSDKLVSIARIKQEDVIESEHWEEFQLTFESVNGKSIDNEKLKNGKYKLSIVLSSSIDGAYFKGAVGSTLYIDELELITEEDSRN
ncbi:PCMD domain-containing protein [Bacteroides sp.]|uniref:PCMD domain-containing protein n=1 Tax=Bacteroides sp. TaxID=29523 RepID=UPI001B5249D2|nr:PCMD domain-containing protein [Bacteroides sp.]MBP6064852.1 PCMD domain-containing protein [Bacteroides sp.]MBP6067104.1 PCMD domain-containing protein [Bacteroides sp.]MBP6936010.1 PCMD domain-containing protein [Bacteroides sp.]MBP8621223.1 PCMD domain-containing protein [Bacteroides sp.]MBP9506940.1 PCMD domain-containing protein [Bacteroides sp.]